MWLKSLELFFRDTLTTHIGRHDPMRISVPTPLFGSQSKVLLLRHDRLGDAIITLPVLRILKAHHPNLQIDVLLSQYNASMRAHLRRYAQHCWVYEKSPLKLLSLLRALREQHYDVIIDPMDNPSATSSLFITLLGCASIGIEKSNASIYTHLVPMLERHSVHIIERMAQVLLPFGISPDSNALHLEYPLSQAVLVQGQRRLGEKLAPYRLGINLSARDPWRYWGRENFIKFIQAFQERTRDVEIILFAAQSDAEEARYIGKATATKVAPFVPTLDEFAAMLVQCDFLLTPDTSIVHIAAAWQVPQVVLYSRVEGLPMVWLPYRAPHFALETSSESIRAISVEDVLNAVESLWKECLLKHSH